MLLHGDLVLPSKLPSMNKLLVKAYLVDVEIKTEPFRKVDTFIDDVMLIGL